MRMLKLGVPAGVFNLPVRLKKCLDTVPIFCRLHTSIKFVVEELQVKSLSYLMIILWRITQAVMVLLIVFVPKMTLTQT
jgi:hypothetical protein